ncbi:unnamed protein product, partial [Prorocentrum cordatum]
MAPNDICAKLNVNFDIPVRAERKARQKTAEVALRQALSNPTLTLQWKEKWSTSLVYALEHQYWFNWAAPAPHPQQAEAGLRMTCIELVNVGRSARGQSDSYNDRRHDGTVDQEHVQIKDLRACRRRIYRQKGGDNLKESHYQNENYGFKESNSRKERDSLDESLSYEGGLHARLPEHAGLRQGAAPGRLNTMGPEQ